MLLLLQLLLLGGGPFWGPCALPESGPPAHPGTTRPVRQRQQQPPSGT